MVLILKILFEHLTVILNYKLMIILNLRENWTVLIWIFKLNVTELTNLPKI